MGDVDAMKLNLGVKIFISFCVITLSIIVVSVIGLNGMYSVKNKYGEIVHDNMPVETLVMEVRSINLEQVASVRGYMIYQEKQYTDQYNSLSNRLNSVFQEIEEKAKTSESKKYLNDLKTVNSKYDEGVQKIFDKIENGNINEAVVLGTTVKEHVEDIRRITEEWSTYIDD